MVGTAANFGKRYCITRHAFENISAALSFSDDVPSDDPWKSIRPLIDGFNSRRRDVVSLGEILCVDECMSAWQGKEGKYCYDGIPHKTKIPRKPEGVGAELNAIADGDSGVLLGLDLMEGAEHQRQKPYHALFGEGTAIVLRLSEVYKGSGCTVVAESAFFSVKTLVQLDNLCGLYFMEMVKTASREYPEKNMTEWFGTEPPRGSFKMLQSKTPNGTTMYALCWADRKVKCLISNRGTSPPGNDSVRRQHKLILDNGQLKTIQVASRWNELGTQCSGSTVCSLLVVVDAFRAYQYEVVEYRFLESAIVDFNTFISQLANQLVFNDFVMHRSTRITTAADYRDDVAPPTHTLYAFSTLPHPTFPVSPLEAENGWSFTFRPGPELPMDASELFAVAHDTLTRTVLRVRDGEQRAAAVGPDAVQAVAMLFAIALLPVLMRVRVLYTFCWVGFTVLAHVIESEAALGIATSLGLTIMMGWYSLRTLDRTTFMGILQGWFGFLSKRPRICGQLLPRTALVRGCRQGSFVDRVQRSPHLVIKHPLRFLKQQASLAAMKRCYDSPNRSGGNLGLSQMYRYPKPHTISKCTLRDRLSTSRNLRWRAAHLATFGQVREMDTMLSWGVLGRAGHEAEKADDRVDAALAVALLFGVVVLPPLVGIRTMYTNCWFAFTVVAHLLASEAALGIATSMGITIMVGWYSLRVFDRYAFTAILNGWLGVWASSPLLGVAARVGDIMLHLLVPMLLVSCYLPLVRVWMSVPALIHFVVGGGVFPKADHIYRFSPPRSQHFWNAAYKMELMLNVLVPLFCVLAHQWRHPTESGTCLPTALASCLQFHVFCVDIFTSLALLLKSCCLHVQDFIVRDDSFWLDWMSEGLVAIGESYVGCLWATNSARTLDEVVASLLTIPMEGRQEMYRSWSARFVALAARLFNYPPSSMGLVVGAVSEQFDLCPDFRLAYMDRYFHQGFGIWTAGTTSIDVAQTNKLANLDQLLDIRPGHTVLDISIGSWGGVGCYLAQQHLDVTVVCILSSVQEFARAKKFARELEVFDHIEFVVAESPEKLLTILSGFRSSKFDRITLCGVVETVPDLQRTRFLRTLKRIQTVNGTTLLEFNACTAAHMMTHAWTNKYVHSAYPCYALTLPFMRRLAGETGFTLRDTVGAADGAGAEREWEKHVDEASDSAYYYNARTGESSWEVPAGFRSPQEPDADQQKPPKWRAFVDDDSGATYYYDEVSGTSRWDEPEGFVPEQGDAEEGEGGDAEEGEGEDERSVKTAENSGEQVQEEEEGRGGDEEEQQEETQGRSEADGERTEAQQEGGDKAAAATAGQWVKYIDAASNKPYYYHASTGKTQWEEPEGFDESAAVPPAAPQASVEYQAHLNRVRTERLARVTQQVLDPSGNLSKLNAILNGIDSSTPSVAVSADESGATEDAPRKAKAEWQQHVDAQTQRYYYHNVVTGVTQWNKPDAPIVSGLADWIPPEVPEANMPQARQKTVSGVNYVAQAKFNRLTGKYEQLGEDEYWQNAGMASDRAGRQMSHFFDMTELEKNREEARRRKEQLKRRHIDWKKISAEKKAKKQKQRNEWLYTD
ncbi:unnamed protein product [Phytophthora fragariaefolia]|uniref:Unnamed protein product n=1 Tax=Phytophthora fragariaefolia TaxID=1490495 RepID=A0A9W7D4Q4_9STRA|nr:unnamed protein product [Phytophthora fragariaefolia]